MDQASKTLVPSPSMKILKREKAVSRSSGNTDTTNITQEAPSMMEASVDKEQLYELVRYPNLVADSL
jgi:hypothetical protein